MTAGRTSIHAPNRAALVVALGVVLAVALVLRSWRIQEIPQVTDESAEVTFALSIAFDGARPLTHTDSYNGPLWPYMMAGALRAATPSIELPRRFTLGFGLAAVTASFALGAHLVGGSRAAGAGAIAGLLMATNYTHTLVGSRVAWSNSTTPFWTTAATLALLYAVPIPHAGRRWALAGFLAGCALNTHPSVSVYLAGLGVWFVLDAGRRRSLLARGPWIAAVCALAAYAPVVVHNVRTRGDSLAQAAASTNVAADPAGSWPANVVAMATQLGRSLGGGFSADGQPVWGLASVAFTALALWLLATTAIAPGPRTGRRLPLVVTLTCMLLLPFVNQKWDGFLEARYLSYLVPLIGAAGSVAVLAPTTDKRRAVSAACALGLIGVSGARTVAHIADATGADATNSTLLHMVRDAQAAQSGGALVLVDEGLKGLAWPNRGDPRRALVYYLTLARVPHEVENANKIRHLVTVEERRVAAFVADGDLVSLGAGRFQSIRVREVAGYPTWGLYLSPGHPPPE